MNSTQYFVDLRNRVDAIRKEADAYAGRAELPHTAEAFLAETEEMDQTADKALALQQELITARNASADPNIRRELDELHNRVYEVSAIVRPRLNRLRAHAKEMIEEAQKQENVVNKFLAEKKARLAELEGREAKILKTSFTNSSAKELNDILSEKQIIKHELERWEN